MDPKIELLGRLSDALTRGQGGFTEQDLSLAFEEVYNMLIQGQLGSLIVEGKLNLRISDGKVLYSAETAGEEPEEAVPLEMLVKNVRGAEGRRPPGLRSGRASPDLRSDRGRPGSSSATSPSRLAAAE